MITISMKRRGYKKYESDVNIQKTSSWIKIEE